MRIQEQYIVPALGGVILLAAISFLVSGSPVFAFVLFLLGLAALGTYMLPHGVQVEVRTAIAVLGLVLLLFYFMDVAFWLALVAFAGIGALQIRHVDSLKMPPEHTIAWVKGRLGMASDADAAAAAPDGGDPAAGADAGDAAAGDAADSPAGDSVAVAADRPAGGTSGAATGAAAGAASVKVPPVLRKILRLNVGGIGATILGLFVLYLVLTAPWIAILYSVEAGGETQSDALGYSFYAAADELSNELDSRTGGVMFVIMAVIALVGALSVVVPRMLSILVCIAGMVMMVASYVYFFGAFAELTEADRAMGISVFTIPNVGIFFGGFTYFVSLILQVIPPLNRNKAAAE